MAYEIAACLISAIDGAGWDWDTHFGDGLLDKNNHPVNHRRVSDALEEIAVELFVKSGAGKGLAPEDN